MSLRTNDKGFAALMAAVVASSGGFPDVAGGVPPLVLPRERRTRRAYPKQNPPARVQGAREMARRRKQLAKG